MFANREAPSPTNGRICYLNYRFTENVKIKVRTGEHETVFFGSYSGSNLRPKQKIQRRFCWLRCALLHSGKKTKRQIQTRPSVVLQWHTYNLQTRLFIHKTRWNIDSAIFGFGTYLFIFIFTSGSVYSALCVVYCLSVFRCETMRWINSNLMSIYITCK